MPGKEIRIGDQDLALRRADRGEVRVLDVAAVAQVVADHELRRLRAGALRAPRRRKQRHLALLELHELVDRPDALHRAHDRDQQRALDAQREVDARRLLPRRVHVVDDVDAADEGDLAVDVAELAVQPPQPVRAEMPRPDLGPILEQLDPALPQLALERGRQVVPGAPSVHEHPHEDAAPRRADERGGHDRADVVVGVDVGLEPDLPLGAVDRGDQRRGSTRRRSATTSRDCPGRNRFIAAGCRCRTWRRARRDRRSVPRGTRSGRAHRRSTGRARRCGRGGRRASPKETCAPGARAPRRTPRRRRARRRAAGWPCAASR